MVPAADLSARGPCYDGLGLYIANPTTVSIVLKYVLKGVALILGFVMHGDHFEPQIRGHLVEN